MIHHSLPAWCAERSMLSCFLTSRQSGYQACCPLERLEMRWGKGESDRLASHSMGRDRGHGHIGLGSSLHSRGIHLPPTPGPAALCSHRQRWLLLETLLRHVYGLGNAPWQCKPSRSTTPLPADFIPCAWDRQENEMTKLTYLLSFYSTAITFSTTGTSLKIKEIEN